jgi:hypothetical protein
LYQENTMKNTWKVAVAAVALMGSASVAKADITLSGPTGLFLNPTAQIAPKDAPEVAVDYQRYSENGFHSNAIGIAGAIQLADKLELNGGFHHFGGDSDFDQWNIGAKYRILSQSEKGIGVAVGADYSAFTDGGGHDFDVYAAGTKAFNVNNGRTPIQGTLGVRYNDNDGGNSKVDVFAGVAVPLTRTGEFSLIGELGTSRVDHGDSDYALGVRYHPQGSAFNVGAGIARHTLFLQAGYQFGR